MIVCDFCKTTSEETFRVNLIVQKEERKGKRRKVISVPFDLCDKHIGAFCKRLGHLKKDGILTGVNWKAGGDIG